MTVLVAGAGIGGLTLALSLHQIGVPVQVFESVPRIEPLGVGINLLPHAVRELTELGLGEALEARGVPTVELAYYSKRGLRIWSEPRGRVAGYRWPQISIHRGRLQLLLLATVRERLGDAAVRAGHHVQHWEERGGSVVARFADGGIAEGAVLVGADGIHSTVRAMLDPDEGPPVWNGAILWRGTTPAAPFLTGRTMIMAGHEFQKFVCYPISPPSSGPDAEAPATLNWIAERKFRPDRGWRREDWNRPGDWADFLPAFEDWRFPWLDVPALIRGGGRCFEYPMVDRDPLPRWTHGRVTLLGDAAHPMYPIGSNGASQAILDARVLTREIAARGAGAEALEAYEAERRPATARIVLANRRNGPEQVMQMVEERAPGGFARIEDVLSPEELAETAAAYKRVAGFDKDELNARAAIVG